jgi:mannose-6-phosphate isomerase
MRPLTMPPNVIQHFYRGGRRIAELRGFRQPTPRSPEEWLAATTHRAGEPGVGLSRTENGDLLRDLIAADPVGWLGSDARTTGDNGILVKLLDPAQRLPVHVHPDRSFALSHLNCPYGKTEAWFVLATSGDRPSVWLGWSADVDPVELGERVDAQD